MNQALSPYWWYLLASGNFRSYLVAFGHCKSIMMCKLKSASLELQALCAVSKRHIERAPSALELIHINDDTILRAQKSVREQDVRTSTTQQSNGKSQLFGTVKSHFPGATFGIYGHDYINDKITVYDSQCSFRRLLQCLNTIWYGIWVPWT